MPPTFVSESEVRVRYAETDAMGVVYHTNYIIWFEVGRADYMRRLGRDYARVEEGGHFLAVSEVGARYVGSARFGDTVIVRTSVEELRSRTITFRYEVLDAASRQPLVTGFTRHVCVDRQGRVTAMPAEVRDIATLALTSVDASSDVNRRSL